MSHNGSRRRNDNDLKSSVDISHRRRLIERLTQTMVGKFGSEAFEIIKSVIESRLSVETAQIKAEVSLLRYYKFYLKGFAINRKGNCL